MRSIVSLFTIFVATAAYGSGITDRVDSAQFQFQSTIGKAKKAELDTGISQANRLCFDEAEAAGYAGAVAAQGRVEGTTGAQDSAQGSALTNAIQSMTNSNASGLCKRALGICKSSMTSINSAFNNELVAQAKLKELYTAANDLVKAQGAQQQITIIEADRAVLQRAFNVCQGTMGSRYVAAGGNAADGALKTALATDVASQLTTGANPGAAAIHPLDQTVKKEGFFDSTAGKVALGVGGAFAVKEIFFDNKDDGGDGGEEERRRAAAADPECKSDRAPEFDHCQKFLREYLCANPANMGDMRCEKWSNNYCGFKSADTADANGQTASALPPPPPGAGTQLCQDTLAFRYCQGANRTSCYSCVSQRDRISAQCQANPASCIRTPSNEEMAHFKASCGDDPVFSLPQWAHIQPAINTNPPPGQPPVDGTTGNVTITGGLMGGSRVPTQAAAASLPADISPLYSPSVVAQAANTVRALCEQGRLNNCGRSN